MRFRVRGLRRAGVPVGACRLLCDDGISIRELERYFIAKFREFESCVGGSKVVGDEVRRFPVQAHFAPEAAEYLAFVHSAEPLPLLLFALH